jgi:hypothetical protein
MRTVINVNNFIQSMGSRLKNHPVFPTTNNTNMEVMRTP